MKNETQSALVARDAAIILLLIWAFMQALLMIWAPADTQTTYLLLLFLMDIAVRLYGSRQHRHGACGDDYLRLGGI